MSSRRNKTLRKVQHWVAGKREQSNTNSTKMESCCPNPLWQIDSTLLDVELLNFAPRQQYETQMNLLSGSASTTSLRPARPSLTIMVNSHSRKVVDCFIGLSK